MNYLEINQPNNDELGFRRKIIFFFIFILFVFVVLIVRLFYLQIVKNQYYETLSRGNKEQIVPLTAYRGEIYDRNGVAIVENVKTYTLSVIPAHLPKNYFEREELLHRISKEFLLDLGEIKNKIKRAGAGSYESVELTNDISIEQMSFLAEHSHEYQGVYYGSHAVRHYPLGETMTHVVGYIGRISQDEFEDKKEQGLYRRDSIVGKEGVEQYYDMELRGIDGYIQWIVDSRNRVKETITPATGKPVPGKKLILTIDSKIQKDAETLIKGINGTIIVSKPTTGEILAMVSSPWYDPNIFIGRIDKDKYDKLMNDPANPFWNKAIRGRYPPASTFKLVSAIGALEEGRIKTTSYKYCDGGMLLKNRFYRCEGRHGTINIYGAIKYSCNTYFYQLAYEVGPNFLKKYSELLGLGEATGIDLPGEKIGIVPYPDWKRRRISEYWWDGDTIQFVIGQGYLSVTPIAVHNVTSAIVNEGIIYKPHVVKEIRSSQTGEVIVNNDKVILKEVPIDKSVFKVVKQGMRMSADTGTARMGAWSPNLKIAAKTGTAQNAQGKSHSWITAFAPFTPDAPPEDTVAVTVMIEHGGSGGLNAGPTATAILRSIFLNEDPIAVRSDIYNRLQYLRNINRQSADTEQNTENEENSEEEWIDNNE